MLWVPQIPNFLPKVLSLLSGSMLGFSPGPPLQLQSIPLLRVPLGPRAAFCGEQMGGAWVGIHKNA